MLACDWCKKGDQQPVRPCFATFAVHGARELPHEFLSHDWELCPACMQKGNAMFAAVIEAIKAEAPGKPVRQLPNPAKSIGAIEAAGLFERPPDPAQKG